SAPASSASEGPGFPQIAATSCGLHRFFTGPIQAGNRGPGGRCQPPRRRRPNQGVRSVISRKLFIVAPACAAISLGAAACGSSDSSSSASDSGGGIPGGSINGAGSTFVAPLVEEWGKALSDQDGLTVNYQAVGSGDGQAELINGTVDFAGSD